MAAVFKHFGLFHREDSSFKIRNNQVWLFRWISASPALWITLHCMDYFPCYLGCKIHSYIVNPFNVLTCLSLCDTCTWCVQKFQLISAAHTKLIDPSSPEDDVSWCSNTTAWGRGCCWGGGVWSKQFGRGSFKLSSMRSGNRIKLTSTQIVHVVGHHAAYEVSLHQQRQW